MADDFSLWRNAQAQPTTAVPADDFANWQGEQGSSQPGFLSNLSSSAANAAQGIVSAVTHPKDTAEAFFDVLSPMSPAGSAMLAEGQNPVYSGIVNRLKQRYGSVDQAKNTFYTDPVGAALDVAQFAGPLAEVSGLELPATLSKIKILPGSIPAKLEETGDSLYQTALKPSTTLPVESVNNMVATGLKEGIPISESGYAKLRGIMDATTKQVKGIISNGAEKGLTIDPEAVAARIEQAKPLFQMQVNPEADMAALEASKQEFLRQHTTPGKPGTELFDENGRPIRVGQTPAQVNPIPVDVAQKLKQGTYKQLEGKYGELASAQVEAQKALARGIKEELEVHFPELKSLNKDQQSRLDLLGTLNRAVIREGNKEPLGLIPTIAMTAAAEGGSGGSGIATAGLLYKILGNPNLRSRLALGLDWASQKTGTLSGKSLVLGTGRQAAILGAVNDYVDSLDPSKYSGTPIAQ